MFNFRLTGNSKTGPIAVTRSPATTCPDSCALKSNGCYAENAPIVWAWRKDTEKGIQWPELMRSIKRLPKYQLWRMNEAGDLPRGADGRIDAAALAELTTVQTGKRGFTYTHYPMTDKSNLAAVRAAINAGFTVNASSDNATIADYHISLGLPTVVILPIRAANVSFTPAGNRVVACPAEKSDRVTCASCGLCQKAGRDYIIGFRAHGARKKTAEKISLMAI